MGNADPTGLVVERDNISRYYLSENALTEYTKYIIVLLQIYHTGD